MSNFSIFTKKTKSFTRFVANNINKNYENKLNDCIEIKGAISGKLFLIRPQENVKITFTKEELEGKVDKEIYDKLPDLMYFV
ncbi:hypothetical protein [uncultured Lutibacter sp.]|uniref:hypothetical protein n=1 Tax=uncultured Lutibacter sp. TaxID=437739 RepID=UPI0026225735|nr:hypothetical protein [uncultured Lutibacter sp.]